MVQRTSYGRASVDVQECSKCGVVITEDMMRVWKYNQFMDLKGVFCSLECSNGDKKNEIE